MSRTPNKPGDDDEELGEHLLNHLTGDEGQESTRGRSSNKDDDDDDVLENLGHQGRIVLEKALGDLPLHCPDCRAVCDGHMVAIRDRVMARVSHLSIRLYKATEIYRQTREFGVVEPSDLLMELYRVWSELSILHTVAELPASE